jgi:thiamine kinase-like enzyme
MNNLQNYQQLLTAIFKQDNTELTLIHGGTTAALNYKFTAQNKTWVLRIFNPKHTLVERETESLVSQCVGNAGIASLVIYADEHCLIREFTAGKILSYDDYQNKTVLKNIIDLLRKQHQISTNKFTPAATAQQRISTYLASINLSDLWQQLNIDFEFYENQNDTVLIHNDLHHANILKQNDTIQFIDWSLAGSGDKFSDLAEIAIYLNSQQQQFILDYYFSNRDHQAELFHAVQQRLLLFAAWALSNIKKSLTLADLQRPQYDFNSWITGVLKQKLILKNDNHFIDFAASCIAEFKSRI